MMACGSMVVLEATKVAVAKEVSAAMVAMAEVEVAMTSATCSDKSGSKVAAAAVGVIEMVADVAS